MLIRVRTNVGLWRVELLDGSSAKSDDIYKTIAITRPTVAYQAPLSFDPGCTQPINPNLTLAAQNLGHGSMVHCRVDPATTIEAKAPSASVDVDVPDSNAVSAAPASSTAAGTTLITRRKILPDGTIQLVHENSVTDAKGRDRGFRKGMLSLRDMKMHWTLAEFTAMDAQYTFQIKRQDEAWSENVSLDSSSCNNFQNYLRNFKFQRQRFGYLYGTFEQGETNEKTKVRAECIYEPPQEANPSGGFIHLHDDDEGKVENLASMLGLKRVGWIFGHPPREKGFQFSSSEVIMAAELQLEAANGVEPTGFVSVKVTVGDDGHASFEAFQISKLCMEMVAEQALEVGAKPGFCYVNESFTAIQEGKESTTVENNFFLTLVPIVQHQSKIFICQFPFANRDLEPQQTMDDLKRQLAKSGSQGWSFIDLLSDFNLLLYLCHFLDVDIDMPNICRSVSNRDIPLDDGYKLIISGIAGLEGGY
mmetsp:Transcript_15051/g.21445  ORF Transcript_15051/g.21445 Transcript_15051/m.21445 type:complete len:476 (-) Transcript_15051:76-1503(-)|eukprot:CAMPEP_0172431466 /NCGR_PEP_ID=MMETSP1064-20121228/58637_1 /TAXON_ID=202472 /ORGANISM="Aulacoseira subarctica , Strain CCAP 1002/5" /LENGTH=475 /DNA_ID=CAMNT_0013178175 /DNA_START=19 /DNA_END=1446 /DNA_ORIENTATION=-